MAANKTSAISLNNNDIILFIIQSFSKLMLAFLILVL